MRKLLAVSCTLVTAAAVAAPQTAATAPRVTDDFVTATPAEPLPPPVGAALARLTPEALAAHVGFLASPALQGRGLGQNGLAAATEYVAACLKVAGVLPLARTQAKGSPESYFQDVPLREITEPGGGVEVERRDGAAVLQQAFLDRVDCLVPLGLPMTITAPVVFAGYGIREPASGRDDYNRLDAAGKVVLLLAGLPPGEAWRTPELVARYDPEDADERFTAKLEAAEAAGAVTVLAVERDWAAVLEKDVPEARGFRPLEPVPGERDVPLVRVSPALANALLAASARAGGSAGGDVPRPLPGVTATLRLTGRERVVHARNVIGVLEGSDEKLKDEAVVIGAHVDHLGKVGDVVYPGADDNASGTAALLEIAKALAASPVRPKRSVVIAFWTGEEEGKLGSGHWVRHPLWPLARTVAYLNLDMIAHGWPAEEIAKLVADAGLPDGGAFLAGLEPADFIEPGVADWAPFLGDTLHHAARGTGLALHLDRTPGVDGGSDYRDFARAHVPFVRFFGSFFPAYHQPGDTPEGADPAQVLKTARLCLATAWLLASP